MNGYLVRALVALLFAALLWSQSRAARDQPHRRRAFALAAGALAALAAFNGALAADAAIGALHIAVAMLAVALLIAAVVSLALSFGAGEMRDWRDRLAEEAREFKKGKR
jgi:peptidoglycan/LPS O-acetylase OafA/YrhL